MNLGMVLPNSNCLRNRIEMMTDKFDILSTLVDFHENVVQIELEMHNISASLKINDPSITKNMIKESFQNVFVDHFKFEELVVFPAITEWDKERTYSKLIKDYLRIHKDLIAEGKRIISILDTNSFIGPNSRIDELTSAFTKLSIQNCSHARHEDNHIVPLINENKTLRFLSGRKMLTYQSIFKSMFPNKVATGHGK